MQSACVVLYSHLWPVLLYHISLHYIIKAAIFGGKKIYWTKCVLIFSTNFDWSISHFKENSARYYHTCTDNFMWNTHYSSQILINLRFSRQIFEKHSNNKLYENASSEGQLFHSDGWTDRPDEVNYCFSQFCPLLNLSLFRHFIKTWKCMVSFTFPPSYFRGKAIFTHLIKGWSRGDIPAVYT
jgi:hypothetical protein